MTHALPAVLPAAVQSVQLAPQPVGEPGVSHVPLVEQQNAVPQGTFALHAAVHDPAEHVGVPPAHGVHAPPPFPHAATAVPIAHCPAVGSQHPPLQPVSPEAPHAAPQAAVDVLHASFGGQSAAAPHPHALGPPFAGMMHVEPFALPTQLAHVGPHAAGPSATHVPV